MSSEVASAQPQSTKRTLSNLQKAMIMARRALAYVDAIRRAAYQDGYGLQGNTVAAGGNLAPLQTVTVGTTGVFDVTVFAGWTSGAGHVTPVLSWGPHGGPLAQAVIFPAFTEAGAGAAASAKIRIPTGSPQGTVLDFAWTTSVGDQTATLGSGGVGSVAASGLIVSETVA